MKPDQYVLQALVAPLALALLPLGVLAGLLGWPTSPLLAISLLVAGPSFLAITGTDVVRSLGRDLQARLWDKAGGSPTTRAFLADDETGADRRRRLQAVTGLSVHQDRASIKRATSVLIDHAGDVSRFPRIPIANASYGRARHLLALRPYGLTIALATDALLLSLLTPVPVPEQFDSLSPGQTLLALAACVAMTAFWVFFPTERRFHRAGDDYADRLLAALDVLSGREAER